MSEVKRYEVKGKFESTGPEGISLIDPKMVLEDDYDAKCHAADVYFGSWKRTEQELDAQRLRADTAEAELKALKHPMNSAQQLRKDLAAAEQRIAELIADVSAREALLSELGCPFDPVSDLYVENKASESMVSLVLGAHRRSKHAVSDAALNQKSEGESHE